MQLCHARPRTTMPNADTLTIETECRGNLIATLQNLVDDNSNNSVEITGHLVPQDKSTGKVFFAFTYDKAEDAYDCELLPKKGLFSYNKLTDKDDNIIAEITENLKGAIYDAKRKEFDSMGSAGKDKTPARTKQRSRISTEAKSSEKKKRAKPQITPAGKLGQEIAGLGLQIAGLKRRKIRATNLHEEYDADSQKYIDLLQTYGKSKQGKNAYGDIKDVLDQVQQIANLRETWSGMTHIVNEMNPKTKKMEGYEHTCLHDLAQLLRATAKYIDSKNMDVEAIDAELKEKIAEFHEKSRRKTDMMLNSYVEGEDFELADLNGVELYYEDE